MKLLPKWKFSIFIVTRTIKYLKFRQILYRILYSLFKFNPKKNNIHFKTNEKLQSLNLRFFKFRPVNFGDDYNFSIYGNRLNILDQGWEAKNYDYLFKYVLHYLNDLTALSSSNCVNKNIRLILQWIDSNPPYYGVGWEPYPVSLRLVNLIKFSLEKKKLPLKIDNVIFLHARFLFCNLEYHIDGNHLFSNAKALIFAGLYFKSSEASRWRLKGCNLLLKCIDEQILDDFGHYERSPLYHSLIIADFLDLMVLIDNSLIKETNKELWDLCGRINKILPGMIRWLEIMTFKNGQVPFFGDTWQNEGPSLLSIKNFVPQFFLAEKQNKLMMFSLESSGFYRLENGTAEVLYTAGEITANSQPGHSHADTFSFEMHIDETPLFINGGTGTYEKGVERSYQRGTKNHNTLNIANKNSTEVWSGFRVGRRPDIYKKAAKKTNSSLAVSASHNGYSHLKGRPIHTRKIMLEIDKLTISDFVISKFPHDIEIRYHFHQDISVQFDEKGLVTLANKSGQKIASAHIYGEVNYFIEDVTLYDSIGSKKASKCLVVKALNTMTLNANLLVNW